MKTLISLVMILTSFNSFAATEVMRRNLRLPSQEVLNKYEVTPLAANSNLILDDVPQGATDSIITTFLAQPDVARNLVLTTGGTTADIKAGNVIVTGLNSDGQEISETFILTDDLNGSVVGELAFLKVLSVSIPAGQSPFGGTIDLGIGTKIGLPKCLDGSGFFIKGLVDGIALPSQVVSWGPDTLEDNTVVPNPLPNGSRKFTFLFVQNFKCAE